MKIINIFLISILISGCASKSMSERADWIVKKVVRKLELDKMQAAKLWAVKHKYFEIRDGKKAERDASFKTLTSFITSDDLVEKEVKNWIKESRKSADEYFPKVFPLVKDFHKSLSKKQKEKAASWIDQIRRRFDI
jgi:hypothetical protein